MDHEGARNLMAVAVEGGLEQGQERDLALHLVGCRECRSLYDGLQTAQSALSRLSRSDPPTRALEEAIHRATTVLLGEADPGPMSPAPAVPPPAHLKRPREEGGGGPPVAEADVLVPLVEPEVPAEEPEGPALPPVAIGPEPEQEPEPAEEPAVAYAATEADVADGIALFDVEEAPPLPAEPEEVVGPDRLPLPPIEHVPIERIPAPPVGAPEPLPTVGVSAPSPDPLAVSEAEPAPLYPPEPRAGRAGFGPWLAAIAATIALALVAGYLITRGQGIGSGDLPAPDEVRGNVARLFTEMKSLKASFSIRRLDLYGVGGADGPLTYSFSDGETTGRIVYDRAEGYREQVTVQVADREISRTRIADTAQDTRTLSGAGASAQLVIERGAALGPPDGPFRPALGMLERSLGTAAAELAEAGDLEVLGRASMEDREVIEVRFGVGATELSRADVVSVLLDARTYFPVQVRREISRGNARVLGPEQVLTDNAIATAFGERQRITTEIVELSDVVIDDIILPGDLVLDVPEGVEAQQRSGGFASIRRSEAEERLGFTPLFPRTLPSGFEERSVAVFTGEPGAWGPNNAYPAPDGIMHASYFDGKTTVTITQRHMPDGPFQLDASPLATGPLPVPTRSVERAEKTFVYAWSPEVPPHAYGFLGNVFAIVSGYLPADQLVAIAASLTEAPAEAPADIDVAPTPEATATPAP